MSRTRVVRGRVGWLALALICLVSGSCGTMGSDVGSRRERTHVVQRGETLTILAQRYGTTVYELSSANRINDPRRLNVGQRLLIPGGKRSVGAASRSLKPSRYARLRRPVSGSISSGFGPRSSSFHEGVDIVAPRGTAVRAAAPGRVVQSGWSVSGYGNCVILEHEDGMTTLYAHHRVNRVRVGQYVQAGQLIGEVGATGRASGPHLHFEVRRDGRPVDPLDFLP